jgi:Glycosyltransferase family 87
MTVRLREPPAVRVLKLLGACLALALSLELVRRAIPMYLPRDWASAHEYDGIADWKGARLFFLGQSPYSPAGLAALGQATMGHPPTTPFWYLPLAEFSKPVAAQLSTFLVWVLLPIHTFVCARELKFPLPVVTAVLVASALFASKFVKYHCDATQYSEPIAVLYVLAWAFLRKGRDARGGVCLGAALTMKLFPGLLLVMLLLARRFRALFAAATTYSVVAILMTRGFGLHAWYDFFREQAGISDEWLGSIDNSSLSGLVVQLLSPPCVAQGHPSRTATLITLGCSLVLLLAAGWLSLRLFKRARETDTRSIDLPFALFALLSVFLNAWVWDHYAVLTVQPLFILAAAFWSQWQAAFRGWCERQSSAKRLASVTAVGLVACVGFLETLQALAVDSHDRQAMLNLWQRYHEPFYHRILHRMEAQNFVTWLVPIGLCFLALVVQRREAGRGVREDQRVLKIAR